MDIQVTKENGRVPVTVFHLSGDLDGSNYEQLETQVQQAISDGANYLILDMSKVPYMSSAGIMAIHQIFAWLRELPGGEDEVALKTVLVDGTYKSRRLKLLKPSDRVQKALSTVGIDMYVEIHDDLRKAVASF